MTTPKYHLVNVLSSLFYHEHVKKAKLPLTPSLLFTAIHILEQLEQTTTNAVIALWMASKLHDEEHLMFYDEYVRLTKSTYEEFRIMEDENWRRITYYAPTITILDYIWVYAQCVPSQDEVIHHAWRMAHIAAMKMDISRLNQAEIAAFARAAIRLSQRYCKAEMLEGKIPDDPLHEMFNVEVDHARIIDYEAKIKQAYWFAKSLKDDKKRDIYMFSLEAEDEEEQIFGDFDKFIIL